MYFKNNLKKWRQGVVASFSIEFTLNKYYKKRWWFFAHRNDVEIKKYVETTRIFRQTKLCQKKVCERTAWIFRPSKLHWKKYVDAMWVFWTAKSCQKKYVKTTWIFRPSKLHQKKYVETTRMFRPSKLHRSKYVKTTWTFWPSKLRRKSTWNRRGFFNHRNYVEKSTWKQRGYFDHRNYIEASTWKQLGLFDHPNYFETSTWKELGLFDHRNYVGKVRGIDVDISTIEITSKKYVESTWKFDEIWSSTYRRNIHVESTSIRRAVPVGSFVKCRLFINRLWAY